VMWATSKQQPLGLGALLEQLRDQLSQLDVTLAAENAAVRDFDADALEKLVARKSRLVATLEALDRNRRDQLAASGLANSSAGMRALTRGDPAAGALWLEIEVLSRRARQAMEANAVLLQAHQRLAVDALAAIYGDRGEPALYEGRASVRPHAPARSLGKA